MAHVDQVDALRAAAVIEREQVSPGEREQLGHAPGLQARQIRELPPRHHRVDDFPVGAVESEDGDLELRVGHPLAQGSPGDRRYGVPRSPDPVETQDHRGEPLLLQAALQLRLDLRCPLQKDNRLGRSAAAPLGEGCGCGGLDRSRQRFVGNVAEVDALGTNRFM